MKKIDLPEKTCAHCQRPMVWRKKWAKVWDEVKFCSERCRRSHRKMRRTISLDTREQDRSDHE